MSIFFPDNDNRRNRLTQLGSDCQDFLTQAQSYYAEFKTLNSQVNSQIVAVYQKAGLQAPTTTSIDVLQAQKAIYQINTADTIVEVSNMVLGVGGVAVTIAYFAPAATTLLVETGVLGAETASTVLISALGAELTVGALAGGIVGGLVVGVVLVGIGLAIDAIEGAVLRDHLRKGIYQTDQLRASTKFALDKSKTLVDLLTSVQTTCQSLLESDIELSDAIIQNLIQKNAIPALQAMSSINKDQVLNELRQLDASRSSWTNEDEAGQSIDLPASAPIYINAGVEVPQNLCPAIPEGLKLTTLQNPDSLESKINYPILKIEGVQYWPFSYIDNREGLAIVAFDPHGNLLQRWDKVGARYIWKIEEDLSSNAIAFVGQGQMSITMQWSELTQLTYDRGIEVSYQSCPAVPPDLKLTALQDPNSLDSRATYPILALNGITYWPLSYTDNRVGMAIVAFDQAGQQKKRWDKSGARYVWKVEENLANRSINFRGQANQSISVSLDELTSL